MPDTAQIHLNVFASTRQPIHAKQDMLITLRTGHQQVHFRDFRQGASFQFTDLPFFNNFGDDYTVLVSAKKHHDVGFAPVKVTRDAPTNLDLMLMPKKSRYNFTNADWKRLKATHPTLIRFLSRGVPSEETARGLYEEMLDKREDSLASLLNITTSLRDILLPVGNAFDYFKELTWDSKMLRQDRFFAYADAALVDQVRRAARQGAFAPAFGFEITHPGATSSFKQQQFGEANIQLTFHEDDKKTIDGVECVKVEPDIDYFKDPLAHFLLEVLINSISGGRTNPKTVYVLRWVAGRHSRVPEFNPPYTIEAAA